MEKKITQSFSSSLSREFVLLSVTTMELASLAMAIFEQRKDEFDLVMADINMQDMTTLSFIEQVLLMKDHMPIVCKHLPLLPPFKNPLVQLTECL